MAEVRLYRHRYECPSCHHTLELKFETKPGLGVYTCPKCGFKAELLIKVQPKIFVNKGHI